jgi:hypothetical protein
MELKHLILGIIFSLGMANIGHTQTETFYSIKNENVLRTEFSELSHELKFVSEQEVEQETFGLGWGVLATKLIPLLVDGASKLFYNPDNFNKEYFANYSFFEKSGYFRKMDTNQNLVFEHWGKNSLGSRQKINRFEFDIGAVKNIEGYHYLGLKAYELSYSWSKLSSPKNRINYVIDIGFYYFDDQDKAQEFHMNPFLLDSQNIDSTKVEIKDINYQVIPKMKVLQTIQVRVREINAKTQNWDRYLELYQSNQKNISKFLINAINN